MPEADGGVWTAWYDWAGRAVREEAADYTVIERDYVGTQLTQERNLDNTPAVLARTSYTYDALGHLETCWGPVDEADWLTQGGVPDADDYAVATLNSVEQSDYQTTTDARGRVTTGSRRPGSTGPEYRVAPRGGGARLQREARRGSRRRLCGRPGVRG